MFTTNEIINQIFREGERQRRLYLTPLRVGDFVKTYLGEVGTIEKVWDRDNSYDFWVRFNFTVKDHSFSSLEPYRNAELKKIEKK